MSHTVSTCPSPWGDITLIRLTNPRGSIVELSSLGAGIRSIVVPDREGRLRDVVLGYANPADHHDDGPCMGKTPGRYANRIANGVFCLDGTTYHLPSNNVPNALHGGPQGFHNQMWQATMEGDNGVCFRRVSPDGEMGYPGRMEVEVRYTWATACDQLRIEYRARTDKATIVNLTNHAYFNLDGEGTGSVLHHRLWLNSHHYLPTDATLIPTQAVAAVEGTPMDFTTPRTLGERMEADCKALHYGKGYDSCWILKGNDGCGVVARLQSDVSGITLEVSTDQPGVQIYTGNWLEGCPIGKSGRAYHDYDGVAIECQDFPDAPNHRERPSGILRPGETYRREIIFTFSNQ